MANERNYGIDLLRIISMIMVPVLHILGQGAILDSATPFSANYNVAWLMEIACYCAVNVYGIISGYVGYGKKHSISRFIELYIQVAFYTLLGLVWLAVYKPHMVTGVIILETIFPFAYVVYWYYTAYFCLFFFMPYLDKLICHNSKGENRKMIVLGFLLFSILQSVFQNDFTHIIQGYSFLWLSFMYLIGAYIRKYNIGEKRDRNRFFFGYILCVLFVWFCKNGLEYVHGLIIDGYEPEPSTRLVSYISPFILASAIFLVLCFKEIEVGCILRKCIEFFAPASFDVYLAHELPIVKKTFIIGAFSGWLNLKPVIMLLFVLGATLGIWFIGSLIGRFRMLIFKGMRVRKLCHWCESAIIRHIVNVKLSA